ncbi:unnamed protein product (macronuclear) [Paramecium tetraurelia]|uniref:RING-type domain-containing protein n=1 Tax=Paramecium tetraurelia TaxID=5888 RepID=A0DM51_PARTE|nr:uncharacterized protein GSPATT00018336001 [Paramecium tetraurelia]CAK84118.1 unnamed protein product [Paramecium tetraurelia]|eukprot:XP_001451515.1 hypothetical protein (macronuclear) [Paramecium tetraurelia strain d4-2]
MQMCRLYSLFKLMMATILALTIDCVRCELTNWMLAVLFHSIIAYVYHTYMRIILNNIQIVLQIAERLNHLIQVEEVETNEQSNCQYLIHEDLDPYLYLNQEEMDRKQKILAVQIRYEVVSRYQSLRILSIITFWVTQILVVWAIRLQMQNPEDPESYDTCLRYANTFQLAFVFLTIYQYLDVYILSLLIVIALPFLIPVRLWHQFKEKKQNYDNQQSLKELKKTCIMLYHFKNIQGDQECGICMHSYVTDEKLLVLPCDPKHHFHLQCIQAWLLINSTCPKCRASFLKFNQQQQQQ